MSKFRNIKQVRYQLAHHLPGIIIVIIRKGQLLIMVKQLLPHIPFHVSSHHMSLIAYVILAESLNGIHHKHTQSNGEKRLKHTAGFLTKQSSGQCAQDLGISQINHTDYRRSYQVQIKHRLVRPVISDKFL